MSRPNGFEPNACQANASQDRPTLTRQVPGRRELGRGEARSYPSRLGQPGSVRPADCARLSQTPPKQQNRAPIRTPPNQDCAPDIFAAPPSGAQLACAPPAPPSPRRPCNSLALLERMTARIRVVLPLACFKADSASAVSVRPSRTETAGRFGAFRILAARDPLRGPWPDPSIAPPGLSPPSTSAPPCVGPLPKLQGDSLLTSDSDYPSRSARPFASFNHGTAVRRPICSPPLERILAARAGFALPFN